MSSPTSTGPAGARFEGQVGAHYLLSMLVEAVPRGLPGTTIDKIELQRAPQGMYLDDVVVRAHDRAGNAAVLEIQVKRTITFAPTDNVFQSVVEQIAKTSSKPEFWTTNYELAIATSATSRKIAGPYQDVLTWARQIGDAKTFLEQIGRAGTSNEDMRTFVETFRAHLRDTGVAHDDEVVWKLLRRLQIFTFDFTAEGSSAEELARERCARALEAAEAPRAGELWKVLTDLALEVAASAGDRDRIRLSEDIQKHTFQLAALPRNNGALRSLSELSRSALQDIDDRVCGVKLTRVDHISAVRAALDASRYVEIRGDAGVGKSGILRHLAEQIATESPVLVLTPDRTPAGGWFELKSKLGFNGECRDLLADLARNGGAVLFVDNLDFFPLTARQTVIDILRQAEGIPGLSIIATARRDFHQSEPSWLPQQSLTGMNPGTPIYIEELSEVEIAELQEAVPRIAWLLSEKHPAREVTRNLYRLSRLSSLSTNDSVPLSEAEMALRWWAVADGKKDEGYIDRARLLQSLAKQVISRASYLDTSTHPAGAINSLVHTETLRELGIDRVAFRHDVLREWAAANLLFADPSAVDLLPLHDAPPADLARAAELCARMSIERSEDSANWLAFLQKLSADATNPLWRRAVLLSLVRSELARDQLTKAAVVLFMDNGTLLQEVIRTVMAVDTEPASKLLVVKDPAYLKITEGLYIPAGPSWARLTRWLLIAAEYLPVPAIPEVAKLFGAWCIGLMGQDPLTPAILRLVYAWLIEIELPGDHEESKLRVELTHDQLSSLAVELRETFLLFCHRTPELATTYLQSFDERTHKEQSMLAILKFRGSLAQAAPKDLVEFTIKALIPEHQSHRSGSFHRATEGPFELADSQFLPRSPAQGPFYDLLTNSPAEGLRLIRRLVDHAVSFFSRGREPGEDAVTIRFPEGPRTFPWTMSYVWSRENTDAPYVVTSALMALEIWAHRRIEAGETIETVIRDVLGDQTTPTAFLLVVVDLLISHWPKSRAAAVPFLASPELLSLDRNRIVFDIHEEFPDLFGLKTLQKEPIGLISLKDLESLPSRSQMLDQLLDEHDHFLEPIPNAALDDLRHLIEAAASRLGSPDDKSTLLDARLMVRYALNHLDPENWRFFDVQLADGTITNKLVYCSPAEELEHWSRLEQESRQRRVDGQTVQIINKCLDLPGRLNSEALTYLIEWAQHKAEEPAADDKDDDWLKQHAIYSVALIAARDGGPALRVRFRTWLLETFRRGLATKEDSVHRVRAGLKFNPVAMGFLGLIYLLHEQKSNDDIRELLRAAGRSNPAAAHGMSEGAHLLATLDERLPRSVLRVAFRAMNKPDRDWSFRPGADLKLEEQDHQLRLEAREVEVQEHIEKEIEWLEGHGSEPKWPEFIPRAPYPAFGRKRKAVETDADSETEVDAESVQKVHTDSQGAGLWLKSIQELLDLPALPWLRGLVDAYKGWTRVANGSGFDSEERIQGEPEEWNQAFFKVVPLSLVAANEEQVEKTLSEHFAVLPEESFYDLLVLFLRNFDQVDFNGKLFDQSVAAKVRLWFSKMMRETHGWKRLRSERKETAEMHLASAISILFFVEPGDFLSHPKAYILEKGVDVLGPFLPVLQEMVVDNPSPYLGNMALILLEVSPRSEQIELLLACAKTWMPIYKGDTRFWRDYGFGKRWCLVLRKILTADSTVFGKGDSRRGALERILANLVTEGIPEASQLEEALKMLDPGSSI
jgi:hypothetical protein